MLNILIIMTIEQLTIIFHEKQVFPILFENTALCKLMKYTPPLSKASVYTQVIESQPVCRITPL
jgi:hypothetical protein